MTPVITTRLKHTDRQILDESLLIVQLAFWSGDYKNVLWHHICYSPDKSWRREQWIAFAFRPRAKYTNLMVIDKCKRVYPEYLEDFDR